MAAGLLTVASLPTAAPAVAEPVPSSQWIVVGVPAANSTTGTLTAYQRVGQEWKAVLGPTTAKVGELGVGVPADGAETGPDADVADTTFRM